MNCWVILEFILEIWVNGGQIIIRIWKQEAIDKGVCLTNKTSLNILYPKMFNGIPFRFAIEMVTEDGFKTQCSISKLYAKFS